MKHMIVIINNVREKCLVSMLTQFRHRGLGDGQKTLSNSFSNDGLQSLFVRSLHKPPPDWRSVQKKIGMHPS